MNSVLDREGLKVDDDTKENEVAVQYTVKAVEASTGKPTTITVDANDIQEAEQIAYSRGLKNCYIQPSSFDVYQMRAEDLPSKLFTIGTRQSVTAFQITAFKTANKYIFALAWPTQSDAERWMKCQKEQCEILEIDFHFFFFLSVGQEKNESLEQIQFLYYNPLPTVDFKPNSSIDNFPPKQILNLKAFDYVWSVSANQLQKQGVPKEQLELLRRIAEYHGEMKPGRLINHLATIYEKTTRYLKETGDFEFIWDFMKDNFRQEGQDDKCIDKLLKFINSNEDVVPMNAMLLFAEKWAADREAEKLTASGTFTKENEVAVQYTVKAVEASTGKQTTIELEAMNIDEAEQIACSRGLKICYIQPASFDVFKMRADELPSKLFSLGTKQSETAFQIMALKNMHKFIYALAWPTQSDAEKWINCQKEQYELFEADSDNLLLGLIGGQRKKQCMEQIQFLLYNPPPTVDFNPNFSIYDFPHGQVLNLTALEYVWSVMANLLQKEGLSKEQVEFCKQICDHHPEINLDLDQVSSYLAIILQNTTRCLKETGEFELVWNYFKDIWHQAGVDDKGIDQLLEIVNSNEDVAIMNASKLFAEKRAADREAERIEAQIPCRTPASQSARAAEICPMPKACETCGESTWNFISLSPNEKAATYKCEYCGKKVIVRSDAAKTLAEFQTEALAVLVGMGEMEKEAMELIKRACKKHPDINTSQELVPLVYRIKNGAEL